MMERYIVTLACLASYRTHRLNHPHHTTVTVHPARRELAKPGHRVGMLSDSLTLAQAMLRQAAGTCMPACLRACVPACGWSCIYV